jgi:hypothetical protein
MEDHGRHCRLTHPPLPASPSQAMRTTRERVEFDRRKYPPTFLAAMAEFRVEMSIHGGRAGQTTNRRYTVEMEYFFVKKEPGRLGREEDKVVLNVSHDKHYHFTKHHFTGGAAKSPEYQNLRQATDAIARRHSIRKSNTSDLTQNGVGSSELISRLMVVLEELDCSEIEIEHIEYGVKFFGSYHGTPIRFRVHFRKDEGTKRKMRATRHLVWESPQPGPGILNSRLQEVIDLGDVSDAFGQLNINANI